MDGIISLFNVTMCLSTIFPTVFDIDVVGVFAVDDVHATAKQTLYVTGKYWPKVLVISLDKSKLVTQLHGARRYE